MQRVKPEFREPIVTELNAMFTAKLMGSKSDSKHWIERNERDSRANLNKCDN